MTPEQFDTLRADFQEFLAELRETATQGASPWRSVDGAAAYLGCGRTSIYEEVASGRLPRKFYRGHLRFHINDLDKLLTDKRPN